MRMETTVTKSRPRHHEIPKVRYRGAEEADRYLASGAWTRSTVGDALRASARKYPQRDALITDEARISFTALDESSERLAGALLELGLCLGDRVIFQMGTEIETAVALLACYKAGIVPVCSLPQFREVEITQLASMTGAKGYFVQCDFSSFDLATFAQQMMQRTSTLQHLILSRAPKEARGSGHHLEMLIEGMTLQRAREILQAAQQPLIEDVLCFQLSGGTTGIPKIIPRFHAEYLGQSATWMGIYEIGSDCRLLWQLPLMHNAGQLYALMSCIQFGIPVVLMRKVDVRRMLEWIQTERLTHALSIGPIAPQLLAYADIRQHDLSSLRLFATLSRADLLEAHLGLPCSNLFGITEGLVLGASARLPIEARHETQGVKGCTEEEIRILQPESEYEVEPGQVGELCFRGPYSLLGYYGGSDSGLFTARGLVRSGDLFTQHEMDGHVCYQFAGRLKDNVNRGGEKIGCEEVEAFVSRHPAISDAKLVSMPDPVYGERGCIFVINRPGMDAPDVKTLATFLAAHGLAKFKCPERIEVVDAFPVTRVGKVDKAAMRALIAEMLRKEQSAAPN
jgi:salicylate---[aryl-carrier protein] ligase